MYKINNTLSYKEKKNFIIKTLNRMGVTLRISNQVNGRKRISFSFG